MVRLPENSILYRKAKIMNVKFTGSSDDLVHFTHDDFSEELNNPVEVTWGDLEVRTVARVYNAEDVLVATLKALYHGAWDFCLLSEFDDRKDAIIPGARLLVIPPREGTYSPLYSMVAVLAVAPDCVVEIVERHDGEALYTLRNT